MLVVTVIYFYDICRNTICHLLLKFEIICYLGLTSLSWISGPEIIKEIVEEIRCNPVCLLPQNIFYHLSCPRTKHLTPTFYVPRC